MAMRPYVSPPLCTRRGGQLAMLYEYLFAWLPKLKNLSRRPPAPALPPRGGREQSAPAKPLPLHGGGVWGGGK